MVGEFTFIDALFLFVFLAGIVFTYFINFSIPWYNNIVFKLSRFCIRFCMSVEPCLYVQMYGDLYNETLLSLSCDTIGEFVRGLGGGVCHELRTMWVIVNIVL